ncbi:hypothetical protein E2C01_075932 [Portunus trituberculatus]|uniref:Uncharacterized protein n=1 Tax=Portunus trituberculatus TaxID=210409 RepID=A0A5B7IGC1_PORTR|nr:hypothetical protein [Portunus trituberculatus]
MVMSESSVCLCLCCPVSIIGDVFISANADPFPGSWLTVYLRPLCTIVE